ncbi:MAG: NUDIX hydrolase [Bacteroidaceae bacterium]|nr:NUDIX hydrolase [Bacteroidaceae bacterium]
MTQQYYNENSRFLLVTDCVVFCFKDNQLQVLLVKKDSEPSKGEWCLPSAFVNENESVDNTVRRALAAKTGLEDIFIEQVRCFGDLNRDPYARIISIMYYALINIQHYDEKLNKRNDAKWFPVKELPVLIYDQNEMVEVAIKRMRYRTMEKPVGLRMLPSLFTISQLHKLVEAIEDKLRDKRNFRKVVEEAYYIEKTEKIDKSSSKRGAALYRFNQRLYDHYLKHKL